MRQFSIGFRSRGGTYVFSLFRLLVFTRWGRYLMAGLALFCAAGVTISAFTGSDIKTKSGTVARWEELVDSNTNAYKSSLLTLSGGSATYEFVRGDFTPSFEEAQFAEGSAVDIWYVQSPTNNPELVAIQITDSQSGATQKFVTDVYTHPDSLRNSNLVFAAVLYVLTLVIILVAAFAPVPQRRRASYGAAVVGGGPPRSTSATSRQDDRPPEHGEPARR
jgi:hypothetical protein